jgi:anti-sigma factor RsiW
VTCTDARVMLDAYADGELDLTRSLEIEAHLDGCPTCPRELAGIRALRTAFSDGALYHRAPMPLERRIRTAARAERRVEHQWGFALPRVAWVGAAAAIVLLGIFIGRWSHFGSSSSDLMAREVVDDHLRSLTQNHLTDVLSSNMHTVKPWFDGKLDFAPPVVDLAAQGFPLVGGRLDYLDNRPVAALVYRRREHIINLFVVPAGRGLPSSPTSETNAGYNIVHWSASGIGYWAVSSLSRAELDTFARLIGEK